MDLVRSFFRSFLRSFFLACSFTTVLPVPRIEWDGPAVRPFPLMLPLVGAALGALWAGLLALSSLWGAPSLLRGAVMAAMTLALTGGLHRDGLMDACDALLSRRPREERLRILSDPHVGAFAVMACVTVGLISAASWAALLDRPPSWPLLLAVALVPAWSRLGMGLMLSSMPFAKEGGLARALGAGRRRSDAWILAAGGACLALLSILVGAWRLPVAWLASLLAWRRACLAAFGGATGDLLGAFAEISEAAMLLALAASC